MYITIHVKFDVYTNMHTHTLIRVCMYTYVLYACIQYMSSLATCMCVCVCVSEIEDHTAILMIIEGLFLIFKRFKAAALKVVLVNMFVYGLYACIYTIFSVWQCSSR
jgi:hypothetical protein